MQEGVMSSAGGVMTEDAVRDVLERERIAEIINTLFIATDVRDWPRVQGCFAPQVTFDMSSLTGGALDRLSPQEITAAWETGLKPLDAIHHQTGNLSIRCQGVEATASCYGTAYHYRRTASGKNTRLFVGSYDFHLITAGSWKIDLFRFNLKFVDGNLELEKVRGA
jgi:hypothetical protein